MRRAMVGMPQIQHFQASRNHLSDPEGRDLGLAGLGGRTWVHCIAYQCFLMDPDPKWCSTIRYVRTYVYTTAIS